MLSADICPNTELLAIAFCGRPPQIWSIEHDVMLSTCKLERDTPGVLITPVSQILFNPSSDVELLAVCYQDGELAIFTRWAEGDHEIVSVPGDALTMAASSGGRTLATGNAVGTIRLWDFETLTLLYCIKSSESDVRSLAFSGDCLRVYDIRDAKTKIWEPSVLARKTVSEESSISEPVSVPVPVTGRDEEIVAITCIHAPPGTGTTFVGRDDGTVSSHEAVSGDIATMLYSHPRYVFVKAISWNASAIASADASSNVDVYTMQKDDREGVAAKWAVGEKLLEVEFEGQIRDLLLHPAAPWLLVFRPCMSTLISVQTGTQYPLPTYEADDYRSWLWLSPQVGSVYLMGARGREIDFFHPPEQQADQHPCKPKAVWQLMTSDGSPAPSDIAHLVGDKRGRYFAVQLDTATKDREGPKLLVYSTAHLHGKGSSQGSEQITSTCEPTLTIRSRHIERFLGFYDDRVVFLDHRLWVRSVNLSKMTGPKVASAACEIETHAERHFYIPRELVGASNGVGAVVTDEGTVVFPKDGELGVVSNAFEWPFKRPAEDTTGNARGASRGRGGGDRMGMGRETSKTRM